MGDFILGVFLRNTFVKIVYFKPRMFILVDCELFILTITIVNGNLVLFLAPYCTSEFWLLYIWEEMEIQASGLS